jgi:hypothetical protein
MSEVKFRYNERSWAIDLISFINSIIEDNKPIQRAGGEYSVSKDSQTLFPDVLLFGDKTTGTILQGWELKMPDTSITDMEFIQNASVKAKNIGLNSFLLWNTIDVNLYIRDPNTDEYILDTNFLVSSLPYKSRPDVQNRPELWKTCTKEIISKLNDYFVTGKIKEISPEIVFSDSGIINQILSCQAEVKIFLQSQSKKDKRIDSEIKSWWRYVKLEYPGFSEPYGPLAYCVIMRWFNRFIFTNILYAYNKIPENTDLTSTDISIEKALDIYKQICDRYDYWNILGPADFDELLPEKVWVRLVNVFKYMHNFEFSKINRDVLGEIIKSTVLASIKKVAGLYSTPPHIAELLVRLSLNEKDGHAIDPFCGTGTIVKQILEIKSEYNIDGKSAIMTTWACDKFAFPVQVATLAFSSPDVLSESLHIFTHDAFALEIGEEIQFVDSSTGNLRKYTIPKFSSIVSNFPFVQFEDIAQLNPEVKIKIENFYKKHNIRKNMQLDGRSDIYAYIPFLLYDLLIDDGYFGFIVSNSWISTKSGKTFRKLLSKFYSVEYIITSGNDRWFKNTKVVTNLVVCRKRVESIDNNEITNFVTITTALNQDTEIDEIAVDIINTNYQSPDIIINQYDKSTILNIEELGLSYNYCFGNAYWLTKNIQKFEKLNVYLHISRGERRGWDKLFFPGANAIESIEEQYLRPVLKTAKGKFEYFVEPDDYAFCCDASLDNLIREGHTGALNWIRNFENGVNEKGKLLVEVLSRKNLYWYQMEDTSLADFVLSVNPDTKIFIQRFMEPSFTNQRLINFSTKDDVLDKELLHAFLNSTIVISQIEALGFGRGETVLDLNPTNLKNGLYIPKIETISDSYRDRIKSYFSDIMKEPVMSIDEIVRSNFRKEFDTLILESINVENDYVKYLYDNLEILYTIRKSAKN